MGCVEHMSNSKACKCSSLWLGHPCLLTGAHHPTSERVRRPPSLGDWWVGSWAFWLITFQRDSSQSLRKTFWACKTSLRRLGGDLHLSGAEKEFTVTHFLKKGCKKREVRAQSQRRRRFSRRGEHQAPLGQYCCYCWLWGSFCLISLEKTLMLGKNWRQKKRAQRMKWLDGITDLMGTNLGKLQEMVRDRDLVCILKYFKVNYRHVSSWVVWKTDCFHLAQVVLEICQKMSEEVGAFGGNLGNDFGRWDNETMRAEMFAKLLRMCVY